jgi:FixJ family two-component response regulator
LIVVVDDDSSTLKSIGRLLNAHGFNVTLFASAEAYLAEPDLANTDCLILDIQLQGMSGIDLQQELLRSGSRIPVIFVTANDSEATRRSVMQLGCVAYIPKPFTSTALLQAVKKAASGKT